MVVLNREETVVTRLTGAEWSDLRRYLRRVTAALDSLFQPDLHNFAFLMNEERWVHLHVVPRYEGPREWGGERFEDPHFGSLFGTEQRLLDANALLRLSRAVAAALEGERPGSTLPTERRLTGWEDRRHARRGHRSDALASSPCRTDIIERRTIAGGLRPSSRPAAARRASAGRTPRDRRATGGPVPSRSPRLRLPRWRECGRRCSPGPSAGPASSRPGLRGS